MKNDSSKTNVIDLTERIQEPDYRERLKGLKVRFDLENAKVAVSTSLLSIVVLVTLANNNLMSSTSSEEQSPTRMSRGIASVPANSMSDANVVENPELVRELGKRDLGPNASVGKQPSSVERLAFGFLEGKYAVRLQNGLLKELEVSQGSAEAKQIDSLAAFIESERALLPKFASHEKFSSERENGALVETYRLLNADSVAVAKVEFRMDDAGRLLAMRVSQIQLASK